MSKPDRAEEVTGWNTPGAFAARGPFHMVPLLAAAPTGPRSAQPCLMKALLRVLHRDELLVRLREIFVPSHRPAVGRPLGRDAIDHNRLRVKGGEVARILFQGD